MIGTVPQVSEVAPRLLVHEKENFYLFIHVLSVFLNILNVYKACILNFEYLLI